MGCAVNGPGEARQADLGVAGGKGEGLLFKHGKPIRKVPYQQLLAALQDELAKMASQ
jgi:(E)-4-hydroxy-3-methylbut-2-enyl-diphosphate synthase